MAKADVQAAVRRLRRMEDLVEDQKRRLAAARERGDHTIAEQAADLLAIYEHTLATMRGVVTARRRSHGFLS